MFDQSEVRLASDDTGEDMPVVAIVFLQNCAGLGTVQKVRERGLRVKRFSADNFSISFCEKNPFDRLGYHEYLYLFGCITTNYDNDLCSIPLRRNQ